MLTFGYSVEKAEARARKLRRWRFRIAAVLVAILVGDLVFATHRASGTQWDWPETVFIFCLVWAVQAWPRRRSIEKQMELCRSFQVAVAPDAITVALLPHYSRTVDRAEILSVEEPAIGRGLYVRTVHRYRWLLIPRGLNDYVEILNLLPSLGFPVVRTRIPPNVEEYLFVIAFCGSCLCTLFARSSLMVTGNLILSAVLAVIGIILVEKGWQNYPRKWAARVGCFLPLAFAAIALFWGGSLAH